MPVHRVSSAQLESKLRELERSGEHVDHVVAVAGGFVLITSEMIELRSEIVERDACRWRP